MALGRVCRYARAVVVLAMAQRERQPAGEPSTALSCTCVYLCSNELRQSLRPSELRHEAKREKVALSERMASK